VSSVVLGPGDCCASAVDETRASKIVAEKETNRIECSPQKTMILSHLHCPIHHHFAPKRRLQHFNREPGDGSTGPAEFRTGVECAIAKALAWGMKPASK
jgi:hypothetical protein